jgi:hypothetical protein
MWEGHSVVIYIMFVKNLNSKSFFNSFKKSPFSQGNRFVYSNQLVREGKERLVGGWLFLSAAGVLGMIILGGYTRLTHSGLSMADWSPYTKRYPRNEEEWTVEFDKYKKTV